MNGKGENSKVYGREIVKGNGSSRILYKSNETPVEEVEGEENGEGDEGDEHHDENELAHFGLAEAVGDDEGGALVGDGDDAGANAEAEGQGERGEVEGGGKVEDDGGE